MSAPTPRKRHSPAVYRRRRIVLVVVLLVIAGLVWLLIAQPWRGAAVEQTAASPTPSRSTAGELPVPGATTPTDTPAPTPTATAETDADDATPSPTPTGTPVARPCVARDLSVEPVTDQDAYDPGQNPQLSITLTNNGAADCTLNVGTSAQSFTIMSGSDVWWRSTDCQTEPSDQIVQLEPGKTVTSAEPLVWDRTRSSVTSCDDDRPAALAGYYNLVVTVGGIDSEERQFRLR